MSDNKLTWGQLYQRYTSDEAAEWLLAAQSAGADPVDAERQFLTQLHRAGLSGKVKEVEALAGLPFEQVRNLARAAVPFEAPGVEPGTMTPDEYRRAVDLTPMQKAVGTAQETLKTLGRTGVQSALALGGSLSPTGNALEQGSALTGRKLVIAGQPSAEAALVENVATPLINRAPIPQTAGQGNMLADMGVNKERLTGLARGFANAPVDINRAIESGGRAQSNEGLAGEAFGALLSPGSAPELQMASEAVQDAAKPGAAILRRIMQRGAPQASERIRMPAYGVVNELPRGTTPIIPEDPRRFNVDPTQVQPAPFAQPPRQADQLTARVVSNRPAEGIPGVVPGHPYSESTSVLPRAAQAVEQAPREAAEFLANNPPPVLPKGPPAVEPTVRLDVPGAAAQPPLQAMALDMQGIRDEAGVSRWWKKYGRFVEAMSPEEQKHVNEALSKRLTAYLTKPRRGESVGAAAGVRGPEGEMLPEAPFPAGQRSYPNGAPEGYVERWNPQTRQYELAEQISNERALLPKVALTPEAAKLGRLVDTPAHATSMGRGRGNTTFPATTLAPGRGFSSEERVALADLNGGKRVHYGRASATKQPDGKFLVQSHADMSRTREGNDVALGLFDTAEEALNALLRGKINLPPRAVREGQALPRSIERPGELPGDMPGDLTRVTDYDLPPGDIGPLHPTLSRGGFRGGETAADMASEPFRNRYGQDLDRQKAAGLGSDMSNAGMPAKERISREQAAQQRLTRQQETAPKGALTQADRVRLDELNRELTDIQRAATEAQNARDAQINGNAAEWERLNDEVARLLDAEEATYGEIEKISGNVSAETRLRALQDPLSQKAAARGVAADYDVPNLDELVTKLNSGIGGQLEQDVAKVFKAVTGTVKEIARSFTYTDDVSKLLNKYYGERAMLFVNTQEAVRAMQSAGVFGKEEIMKFAEAMVKENQAALRKSFIDSAIAADPRLSTRQADELVSDLFEAHTALDKFLRHTVGALKTSKVLYSPTAWVNNVLGNIPFALLGGGGLKKAIDGTALAQMPSSVNARGSAAYREALAHGLFGSEFFAQDTKAFLRTIADELGGKTGEEQFASALMRGGRKFHRKLAAKYDGIDKAFKMGAYMDARARGLSPQDAVEHVYKFFPNYEKLATPFASMRKSKYGALFMNPFMAFPLESMRIFKNVVKENPARAALAVAGLYGAYNYGVTMGEFTGWGPTREEIRSARAASPSYRSFGGRFTVPYGRGEDGQVNALDITSWIPLLDLVSNMQPGDQQTAFGKFGSLVANIGQQTFLRGLLTSDYYQEPGTPGFFGAIAEAPGKLASGDPSEMRDAVGDVARTKVGNIVTPPIIQRLLNAGRQKRYEEKSVGERLRRDFGEAFSGKRVELGSPAAMQQRQGEIEAQMRQLSIERARNAANVNISERVRQQRNAEIEARMERVQRAQ